LWNCRAGDNSSQYSFATSNRTFTVDSIAPTITLPVYTNATQKKNTDSLTYNISVSDSGAGASYCSINVNTASAGNVTVAVSNGWCNGTYSLTGASDGNQTINAYANDTLGNTALNNSYVVWLDSSAPTITHDSPANATYFNYAPYFNGTCSDSGAGLDSIYTNLTEYDNIDSCIESLYKAVDILIDTFLTLEDMRAIQKIRDVNETLKAPTDEVFLRMKNILTLNRLFITDRFTNWFAVQAP